ncbi:MAG: dUTP diphosphatase [Actinobacteria bacterium]|nr:MAG: dUTP diphosphatase [Actinomycetota bacterium]
MRLRIKKLSDDATVPVYAYHGDAGCDLFSCSEVVLPPGGRAMVPTGLALAIPDGYAGFVQPRSGLAAKHGVSVLNTPGLIDSKYRGEVCVILVNLDPSQVYTVAKGEKIAQLVIQRVEEVDFDLVEELDETARGVGGFGSSGRA